MAPLQSENVQSDLTLITTTIQPPLSFTSLDFGFIFEEESIDGLNDEFIGAITMDGGDGLCAIFTSYRFGFSSA